MDTKVIKAILDLQKLVDKDYKCVCEEFNENCEGCHAKKAINVLLSLYSYEG